MIPLKEPFIISLETITHAHNMVVIIHTDQGIRGMGECSPYRTINGETPETNMVVGRLLAKVIMGQSFSSPLDIFQLMHQYIAGNNCIKSAFDMALYDICAKRHGLPLYQYLGASQQRQDIETDMTVSLMSPEAMATKAAAFINKGFNILKVKVGDDIDGADIARLQAIRHAIPDHIPLRLDANQGWSYATALSTLRAAEHMNVEHCEEPIDHADIDKQALLSSLSPIPIMADECVFTSEDLQEVIRHKAAHRHNIKLAKAGGITEAMRIASLANLNQMNCQVGSFSESRLGITALTHFAMANPCVKYFDLDAPLMLAEDPVEEGMIYHDDWSVTLPETPGLGAYYNQDYLDQFRKITIK